MKKQVVLLVFVLIVIVGLFAFSTWTQARVITEDIDLSPGVGWASKVSPLFIGLFVVLGLAIVALIGFDFG